MSEDILGRSGDGALLPVDTVNDDGARIAADAEELMLALTAVAASRPASKLEAVKHGDRLAFGLARLQDLQRAAADEGGAFAPARAEVAASILEGHVALAAGFVHRVMRGARRAPGRRTTRVEVDEATNSAERARRAA